MFDTEEEHIVKYEYRGKSFTIKKEPVHGFWTIGFSKGGNTPAPLSGHWTGLAEAEIAVRGWVDSEMHRPAAA